MQKIPNWQNLSKTTTKGTRGKRSKEAKDANLARCLICNWDSSQNDSNALMSRNADASCLNMRMRIRRETIVKDQISNCRIVYNKAGLISWLRNWRHAWSSARFLNQGEENCLRGLSGLRLERMVLALNYIKGVKDLSWVVKEEPAKWKRYNNLWVCPCSHGIHIHAMTFLNFPNDFQAFIWSAKDVPSHSFFSAVLGMRHLVPLLCGQLPRESALYRWMRNIHELKCFLFVQVLRKLNAKIKMSKPICPARSSPPLSLISMLAKQGARTNFRPNSEEPLYSRMPWRDLSPLQLASGIFSSRPHICHTMRLVWKPSDHAFF